MSSSIVAWSSHACFAAAATSETAPPCTTSSTVLQHRAGQQEACCNYQPAAHVLCAVGLALCTLNASGHHVSTPWALLDGDVRREGISV
jgi:hypothetical protein